LVLSTWVIAGRESARAADEQFTSQLAEARSALNQGRLADAKEIIERAVAIPGKLKNTEAADLLNQVKQAEEQVRISRAKAEAATMLRSASSALEQQKYQDAAKLLEAYLKHPHASESAQAKAMLREVDIITSEAKAQELLDGLTEAQFADWSKSGTLPIELTPTTRTLADAYLAALQNGTAEAKGRREERARRLEAERLAQLEAERERAAQAKKAAALAKQIAEEKAERDLAVKQEKDAEAARKKKEADAEAARRAEEEHDAKGLILLLKTVKGLNGEFTMEITGTVVNRRANKLRYAQITFNVYDASGAQVGTALANISGLEADGRWNFKAVYLGTNGKKYKFSELSGF
jgi:hypothetical protein